VTDAWSSLMTSVTIFARSRGRSQSKTTRSATFTAGRSPRNQAEPNAFCTEK
jgi:hypothetical protein